MVAVSSLMPWKIAVYPDWVTVCAWASVRAVRPSNAATHARAPLDFDIFTSNTPLILDHTDSCSHGLPAPPAVATTPFRHDAPQRNSVYAILLFHINDTGCNASPCDVQDVSC